MCLIFLTNNCSTVSNIEAIYLFLIDEDTYNGRATQLSVYISFQQHLICLHQGVVDKLLHLLL